jgi:hypothetical protein
MASPLCVALRQQLRHQSYHSRGDYHDLEHSSKATTRFKPIDSQKQKDGDEGNRDDVKERCCERHSVSKHRHHGLGVLAVHVEKIESRHRGQGYRYGLPHADSLATGS